MNRLVVASCLALCSLACPRPTTPPTQTDAGIADFVGRSCDVDAECGTLRCDKVRRQCICLSDLSCISTDPAAAPRYCNNYTGLCVTEISGCTANSQCAATEFCDSSTRSCRPLKSFCQSCTSNAECGGQGDNCVLDAQLNRRFCGTACSTDTDCPRGATCQDKDGAKQCWPNRTPTGQTATCNTFAECVPDSLATCANDTECGADQRCDAATGRCLAAQRICPFGTTCDPRLKLCVSDCLQDVDCGDPNLRCVNRVCEPITDCMSDTECTSDKSCTFAPGATVGQCKVACAADRECPLGQVCSVSNGRAACKTGCSANVSCPLNQRCNATTKLCEGPTVGTSRICQATSACNSCELCDGVSNTCSSAKTSFPHCQSCVTAAECAGGACVGLPVVLPDGGAGVGATVCARFCGQGQQECPQGFACATLTSGQQACIPSDRTCTGKCP